MIYLGMAIALCFIIVVAYALTHKYNPQAVLLISGILMICISLMIGTYSLNVETDLGGTSTGWIGFDLFSVVKQTMKTNALRVGLMIMTLRKLAIY